MDDLPIRVFEPHDEVFVTERMRLPHWSQTATLCFITWRTHDSIPAPVMSRWLAERDRWLRDHDIDANRADWQKRVADLPPIERRAFQRTVAERFDRCLDDCLGKCPLREPKVSRIVAESLRSFDGERYFVTDFVVMPNHVHVLASFRSADEMLRQCESWKRFTATAVNRELDRRGRFWQVGQFDHLVRSEEEFLYLRQYIRENPIRANLLAGEFNHYSLADVASLRSSS